MTSTIKSNMTTIGQRAAEIEEIIQRDPGNRGLANWAVQGHLLPATESLLQGNHILLTTGFYIMNAGEIETDGPPGAIVLADALIKLGKTVTILVDNHSLKIMEAGLKALNCPAELLGFDREGTWPDASLIRPETTHFVSLERPGQAADGKYYNFRGKDISFAVTPMDHLFALSGEKGIVTIGIGDGGNELGMGHVSENVDTHVAPGRDFSCQTHARHCVCAGVSNWGGYGMGALLSLLSGRNVLPGEKELSALLDGIVEAGAVDGVSGLQEATVDGLEAAWEMNQFNTLYEIAREGAES
ncbi:MAG: DUF4392 domain-containing protein [Spirochaetales bacterium]|nr:DUF4392 domain-containing protein [Spirochaetales bacterium]